MHSESNLLQLFQRAKKYLNNDLLDTAYSKRIESLHAFLPQLNMVNYEFRLDEENARVDANIMVWKYEAPTLLSWLADKKENFYQALYRWVKDWLDPNHTFHSLIQNIWIMYDLEEGSDEIPEPWIVFSFTEFHLGGDTYISLIKRIATYFKNGFSDDHWKVLDKIYSELKEGQSVPAVGFQNRSLNSIRLGVKSFFDFRQMESYLKRIGWYGDFDFIQKHYGHFISEASYTMVSMTFNEALMPVVGIECYMNESNNLIHSTEFLNKLVEKKLCTEKKCVGLMKWIGDDHEQADFRTLANPSSIEDAYIRRWLLEVKLVVDSDKIAKAKAYVLINQTDRKFDK